MHTLETFCGSGSSKVPYNTGTTQQQVGILVTNENEVRTQEQALEENCNKHGYSLIVG